MQEVLDNILLHGKPKVQVLTDCIFAILFFFYVFAQAPCTPKKRKIIRIVRKGDLVSGAPVVSLDDYGAPDKKKRRILATVRALVDQNNCIFLSLQDLGLITVGAEVTRSGGMSM